MSEKKINLNPEKIPFIFKDVTLTVPANKELKEWLLYMIKHYPEDLRVIHRRSQLYVKHGGSATYDFARWIRKLEKACIKTNNF